MTEQKAAARCGARRFLAGALIWSFLSGALFIAVLAALAPHSEWAWTTSFRTIGFVKRIVVFAKTYPSGQADRRCSMLDVWNQAVPVDGLLEQRSIEKSFRILQADGDLRLVDTPAGPFWVPRRDTRTLAETLEEQQHEIYGGSQDGVRPGDIVLDCGANIGVYTRHALSKGARLVVAIEPAPVPLECLRRNLRRELAEGRVVIYPKGVWNKDDLLTLGQSSELASTAASVVLDSGSTGPQVPLTTIDKLVDELKLEHADLIKMDIEGAEAEALEGATRTVARFRPRLAVSLEHRVTDPNTLPALVKRLWPGYSIKCGPCENVNGNVQPNILFAHSTT